MSKPREVTRLFPPPFSCVNKTGLSAGKRGATLTGTVLHAVKYKRCRARWRKVPGERYQGERYQVPFLPLSEISARGRRAQRTRIL